MFTIAIGSSAWIVFQSIISNKVYEIIMAEAVGSGRLLPEYELSSIGDVLRLRKFYVSIYSSNQLGKICV